MALAGFGKIDTVSDRKLSGTSPGQGCEAVWVSQW